MTDAQNYKVPKAPFYVADALLIGFAWYFVLKAPNSTGHWEIAAVSVALGAVLGIVPFVMDYRYMGKLIEVNSLGAVADKIQDLEQFTEKISAATNQWAAVHEATGGRAEMTAAAAKQIADKMSAEVREFSEFMKKMNDSEKATLRLEVEKLRRGEGDWLQMLVRLLDHVFVLHTMATRSNQPQMAEQITQFQNACRGTVRRIGLVSFTAEPNEAFDAQRFQNADGEKPADGAVIAETLAAGYTFQGRLLRPALVKLRETTAPEPDAETETEEPSAETETVAAVGGDLDGKAKATGVKQDTLALDGK